MLPKAKKPRLEPARKGRKKATTIYVQSLHKIQALQHRFKCPKALVTFQSISDWIYERKKIRVSAKTLYRFADGNEPKNASLRQALGLQDLKLAPTCKKCGEVHVTKRCTVIVRRTLGPRRNWKKAYGWMASLLWHVVKIR